MWKSAKIACSSLLATALLAACGGEKGGGNAAEPNAGEGGKPPAEQTAKPPEPVELTFYLHTTIDDFEKYINQFVKQKFPHVTLKVVKREKGSELSDLIAANMAPDIVWEGLWYMTTTATKLDLPLDLKPLAQKHGFDFGQYDPALVSMIESLSSKGEMLFLPYNSFVFATQYNKDIFDKFGEPYLKDNMTWEEMIEIGRKLTRTEDGVQYRGIQHREPNRTQLQLGLQYLDPATGKATFLTDDRWKTLLESWKAAHNVPGYPAFTSFSKGWDDFAKNKVLAIWPDLLMLQNYDMVTAEQNGLKWDVVTYPTFKDRPGIGTAVSSDGFYVTKTSKHPDLAFQIVSYLSANRDVQLEATKNGRITGLNDPEIRKHAFSNNPAAKGKNLANIFRIKPAATPLGPYDREGLNVVSKIVKDYINDKADANTLLRQADEELNKTIEALKNQ
jgi:multiple sugar transport system substrate-binding protein